MKPSKALITSANPTDKHLPLQSLVDSKGNHKTALQILLDEVFNAGIQEAAIVIPPGEKERYQQAAGNHLEKLTFLEQNEPLGYGHAITTADAFINEEPFLLLVGDHLFRSFAELSCIGQLMLLAEHQEGAISGVQPTHESQLQFYGTVAATLVAGTQDTYEVSRIHEKPTPTQAEQSLIVPGLRTGHYLCFFGMHILPGRAMTHLTESLSSLAPNDTLGLTDTLNHLAESGQYHALKIDGQRFNLGQRYGLLRAQLAFSLAGKHRDEVMSLIIELLASEK